MSYPFRISPHPQGSPMWHADRAGLLTTSQFHRITTPARLEPSKSVEEYISEAFTQWWTGQPCEEEWSGSYWTDRGTAMEPEARTAFAVATGYHCEEIGFIRPLDDRWIGTSLDSLVRDKPGGEIIGTLELKCPGPKGFSRYWMDRGAVPRKHLMQTQGQLHVTGLTRGWFQAYYPNAPEVLIEFSRDDAVQDALSAHLDAALERYAMLRGEWIADGGTVVDPLDAAADVEDGGWEGAA